MAAKIGKKLNQKDTEYFLNITEEDITTSFIMNNFAMLNGNPAKFEVFDLITIPKGAYGNDEYTNDEEFETTLGSWIYNKFFIEKELINIFGYDDNAINNDYFEDHINDKLAYSLLEDDINLDQFKHYLEKTQKFTPYVSIWTPSVTMKLLLSNKEIAKEKKRLLKKYEKEIAEGNEVISEQIEKELLDYAAKYLEDDDSMECYNSKARMKFKNHYKNSFVMRGAAKDPDANKGYNVMTSNYMEGFSRDEYATLSNSLATGPYLRGIKTGNGGYLEKLTVNAFQHVKLGKPGSDCGTKRYLTVKLDNPKDWIYSYIIEGNNLVELTSKNMDKYKGKTVKLRFSALCESKHGYCNKCIGNLPYRTEIGNIGMAMAAIPAKLKLLCMKGFHDSNIKTTEIDLEHAFPDWDKNTSKK